MDIELDLTRFIHIIALKVLIPSQLPKKKFINLAMTDYSVQMLLPLAMLGGRYNRWASSKREKQLI